MESCDFFSLVRRLLKNRGKLGCCSNLVSLRTNPQHTRCSNFSNLLHFCEKLRFFLTKVEQWPIFRSSSEASKKSLKTRVSLKFGQVVSSRAEAISLFCGTFVKHCDFFNKSGAITHCFLLIWRFLKNR